MDYKYVVVILVYRNIDDLEECVNSIYQKMSDVKIIIVNSFYDEESFQEVKSCANNNKCDFVNTENKGYGHGNNIGISYAVNHYKFDYIIIANPDIIVRKFDDTNLEQYDVIAPKIITLSGKKQNPIWVFDNKRIEKIQYIGYKYSLNALVYLGIAINKIIREAYNIFRKTDFYVYGAHGSFIIFKYSAIKDLLDLFDENMFMYAEETLLAYKLNNAGIKVRYTQKIEILHKEDGSVKLSSLNVMDEIKKSFMYYYSHYRKNQ